MQGEDELSVSSPMPPCFKCPNDQHKMINLIIFVVKQIIGSLMCVYTEKTQTHNAKFTSSYMCGSGNLQHLRYLGWLSFSALLKANQREKEEKHRKLRSASNWGAQFQTQKHKTCFSWTQSENNPAYDWINIFLALFLSYWSRWADHKIIHSSIKHPAQPIKASGESFTKSQWTSYEWGAFDVTWEFPHARHITVWKFSHNKIAYIYGAVKTCPSAASQVSTT